MHPPYLSIEEIGPVGEQGRHCSRVGSFPEARPVLGEVTETMCAAGTSETRCGFFPRASHTPGESAFAEVGAFPGWDTPRVRVPFRLDRYSPDED